MAAGVGMELFAVAASISLILITLCVTLFYEIMAHIWVRLPRLEKHPRKQILLTVAGSFLAHTIAVWMFGLTYYVLATYFHFGSLKGEIDHELLDYVYFSAVSYSSLGLGDVYPAGGLQLLVGVEAILGLILIGWTVTFTYIVTNEYLAHRLKKHGKTKD
jgi:hypothetical protein